MLQMNPENSLEVADDSRHKVIIKPSMEKKKN